MRTRRQWRISLHDPSHYPSKPELRLGPPAKYHFGPRPRVLSRRLCEVKFLLSTGETVLSMDVIPNIG